MATPKNSRPTAVSRFSIMPPAQAPTRKLRGLKAPEKDPSLTRAIGPMDQALDIFFFVFHTAWIVFNCLGWIWKRTRPWQIATVSLTALSWIVLGARYGWGYCPCTDWHWRIRERLGHVDPPSYVQLLIRELTGVDPGPAVADALAVTALTAAAALGVTLHLRDRRSTLSSRKRVRDPDRPADMP
jgi:hypothetical protein